MPLAWAARSAGDLLEQVDVLHQVAVAEVAVTHPLSSALPEPDSEGVSGMMQRAIWLLDEPSVGLDRASVKQLTVQMSNHLEGGGIIIAATHGEFAIPCASRIELGDAS